VRRFRRGPNCFASGRIFWLNWPKSLVRSWQHCPYPQLTFIKRIQWHRRNRKFYFHFMTGPKAAMLEISFDRKKWAITLKSNEIIDLLKKFVYFGAAFATSIKPWQCKLLVHRCELDGYEIFRNKIPGNIVTISQMFTKFRRNFV
jgi:hypothetical protein